MKVSCHYIGRGTTLFEILLSGNIVNLLEKYLYRKFILKNIII